ncbi:MAG: hypothetical protein Kow0047_23090 [Anaerolineae bacterium]
MAQTMSHTGLRLNRTVLVALGERACRVAGQCWEISRRWLGTDPPLEIFGLDPNQSEVDAFVHLAAVCDRLASERTAATLNAAGYGLDRPDEIRFWLIIEVSDSDLPPAEGVEPGRRPRVPERVASMARRFDELTFQRLRAHATTYALLLAEPAHGAAITAWGEALGPAISHELYLSGPVTYEHLRVDEEAWEAQAARTLATLLWSQMPPRLVARRPHLGPSQIYGVNATAWPAPPATIRRWLALLHLQRFLEELGRRRDDPAAAVELPQPERWIMDLGAATAQGAPKPPSLNARPPWNQLITLATTVQMEARRREEAAARHRQRIYERWRAQQVDAWRQTLDRLEATLIDDGVPHPATYAAILDRLAEEAKRHKEPLRLAVDRAEGRKAEAQAAVEQRIKTVDQICRSFPPPTWRGLLRLITRPWNWPIWVWDYAVRLPEELAGLQIALDAQAQAEREGQDAATVQAAWEEIATTLEERRARAQAIMDAVMAVSQIAAEMLEEIEHDLPSPWKPEQGDRLWRAWAGRELWRPPMPLTAWPDHPAEEVLHQLLDSVEGMLGSAAALRHPLSILLTCSTDEEIGGWIDRQIEHTSPMWPEPETVDGLRVESWILQAETARTEEDAALSMARSAVEELIEARAGRDGHVSRAVCGLPGIAVIRRCALDGEMEAV